MLKWAKDSSILAEENTLHRFVYEGRWCCGVDVHREHNAPDLWEQEWKECVRQKHAVKGGHTKLS